MTSHPPVTPTDLRSDPELAILDALEHTIGITIYALVAIHPELTDDEIPPWRRESTATAHEASNLIQCSEELQQAVSDYRTALRRAREAEANQDLPF